MLIEEREVEVTAERTISSDESGLDRIQLKSLSRACFKSLVIYHYSTNMFMVFISSYKGGLISENILDLVPIINFSAYIEKSADIS